MALFHFDHPRLCFPRSRLFSLKRSSAAIQMRSQLKCPASLSYIGGPNVLFHFICTHLLPINMGTLAYFVSCLTNQLCAVYSSGFLRKFYLNSQNQS